MKLSKFLVGQISITALVTAGGLVVATQVAAVALKPRPLGQTWFALGKAAIYTPARLPEWWSKWGSTYRLPFERAATVIAFSLSLGFLLSVGWRKRMTFRSTTYGSSRWANSEDIEAAGFYADNGVVLGERDGQYLRHDGPEHVMVVAPTRSGKGVGLVIPTLLSWRESVIVHDIKGENWALTAEWRSRISHCLLFNPTEPMCARFNPLLEVRKGANEIRDAQNIADILIDPDGANEHESHWRKTSHSLLVAMIIHVLYAEKDKTLARVAELMCEPGHSFTNTLHRMMETNHLGTDKEPKVHPVVAETAQEVLNKWDNERSSVVSTAVSFLGVYRDPLVAQATAASDWRIEDLIHSERAVSLYLVVPPSDISRTRRLMRLILSQIGRRLTESVVGDGAEDRKHDLLLLLDEFPQLGKLDFFQNTMAYMAHYGLKAFLIAQSLNQIDEAYGANNSILDNCHVRVVFSTNDDKTAKRISDALGTTTESRTQRNFSGKRMSGFLSHENVSRQEIARPLLTLGEVMQFPWDKEMILMSGVAPIQAQRIKHYTDRNFTERLLPAPFLEAGLFSDRPTGRGNGWVGQVRKVHPGLKSAAAPVAATSSASKAGTKTAPKAAVSNASEAIDPEAKAPAQAPVTPPPAIVTVVPTSSPSAPTTQEGTVEKPAKQRARKAPVLQQDLFAAYGTPPVRSLLPDRGVSR